MRKPLHAVPASPPRFLRVTRLVLTGIVLSAGSSAYADWPFRAAEDIDPIALERSVHAWLAESAEILLQRVGEEETLWPAPPRSTQTRVGEREVTIRYRQVEVEVPVWEWIEYQEVVRRQESAHDAAVLETVTRRRRGRQIGTRKETRLIRDPEGPIVRQEIRPVFGSGGPEAWSLHGLGHNAQALYALRVAGVAADEPRLARLAERLRNHLLVYGPPDGTYDLAWLTAAFARMPGEDHADLTRRLAGRLLLGQIPDGPAAGLWPSLAIPHAVVIEVIRREQALSEQIRIAQERMGDRSSRSLQDRVNQAEAELRHLQGQHRWITCHGFLLNRADRPALIEMEEGHAFDDGVHYDRITRPAPPYPIYELAIGDLELAAWALFALREAHGAGRLPERLPMPTQVDGQPVLPPDPALARIRLAAQAVARRQERDGSWGTGAFAIPIRGFEDLGARPGTPPELPDRPGVHSTAAGWLALREASRILPTAEAATFGAALASGERRLRAELAAWTRGQLGGRPTGRLDSPTDLLPLLRDVAVAPGTRLEPYRTTWNQIADAALRGTSADSGWSRHRFPHMDAGVHAWYEPQVIERFEREHPGQPREGRDWEQMWRRVVPQPHWGQVWAPAEIRRARLMPFLADGARRPLAGQWALTGQPSRLSSLDDVMAYMEREYRIPARFLRLGPEIDASALRGLAALFLAAEGDPRTVPDGSWLALGDYLASDGMLVIEYADQERGQAWRDGFLALLESKSGRAFPPAPLSPDHPVWREFTRPARPVAARTAGHDRPAILLVPIHPGTGGPPAFSLDEAREFTFRILRLRADSRYWDEDYALGGARREE